MLPKWSQLPESMRNKKVRLYYESLYTKQKSLKKKRIFDIVMSALLLFFLSPVFIVIAVLIKKDSKGPIFFKQVRVTSFDQDFIIYKFRSMVTNAPELGSAVTISNDARITKIGSVLRKYRLDELPQLWNVLIGDMSFVGTRPEVRKYVDRYSPVMMATLLMPAGITSVASIKYKEEDALLANAKDVDETYIKEILPEKMKYNLRSIRTFSCFNDIKTMICTVIAVFLP